MIGPARTITACPTCGCDLRYASPDYVAAHFHAAPGGKAEGFRKESRRDSLTYPVRAPYTPGMASTEAPSRERDRITGPREGYVPSPGLAEPDYAAGPWTPELSAAVDRVYRILMEAAAEGRRVAEAEREASSEVRSWAYADEAERDALGW